ncbi:hypothetical protein K438DRAFT_27471 [Mycena galopus ATCC 62051]|nr:hypothetical protein K438DRAFT_27471 [Mycena galopus ATCC 62051]
MHLFNLFKAFGANSSSQSAGEAEIGARFSNGSVPKRRRLKRRTTKHCAPGYQPEETRSLSGIQIPDARNAGFRSAPNLLTEPQGQDRPWSPIPTLEAPSAARAPYSRLRENLDGSPLREYEQTFPADSPQNPNPPPDDDYSSHIESPIFGPREEGLFRNEMPYDMESPLSQLASGWRESPRYVPRRLPTPPFRSSPEGAFQSEEATSSIHSKEVPPQWRDSPELRPTYRTVSPEPFHRYEAGSRHSSEMTPHSTVDYFNQSISSIQWSSQGVISGVEAFSSVYTKKFFARGGSCAVAFNVLQTLCTS